MNIEKSLNKIVAELMEIKSQLKDELKEQEKNSDDIETLLREKMNNLNIKEEEWKNEKISDDDLDKCYDDYEETFQQYRNINHNIDYLENWLDIIEDVENLEDDRY